MDISAYKINGFARYSLNIWTLLQMNMDILANLNIGTKKELVHECS